ncbi:hypothetical protein ACFRMQ_02660 [Kitasatospora sp. NPDC056783]|uniref:hypothetical protein n=1 Tax=Kitasatospora sp. NPDC056783 TaxID=3345943 RepID=UPI0036C9C322
MPIGWKFVGDACIVICRSESEPPQGARNPEIGQDIQGRDRSGEFHEFVECHDVGPGLAALMASPDGTGYGRAGDEVNDLRTGDEAVSRVEEDMVTNPAVAQGPDLLVVGL